MTRVLVTAGAAGIGRCIAEAFMKADARVHICDVDEAMLARSMKELPGLTGSLVDVANEAQVDRLFDDVKRQLGGLDVLVNNAGIAGPTGPVETLSLADWERTLGVNLTSQFLCTRRAVPLLKEAGGGSIVNLSSVAGRLGYPLRTPYASAKWAVVGFSKSLASELGRFGIRVNAIQPGIVAGERMKRVIAARAASQGKSEREVEDQYLDQISLRRMVEPTDIAAMVMFLCSEAGRNITGQAISVCGNVESLK